MLVEKTVTRRPYRSLQLPQHEFRLATISELRKTDLEWTRFYNGYFLDYYGMPHVQTHLTMPVAFVVDMPNKAAAIPGTGDDPISFTYTRDVAKFAVKALDLPNWHESMFCYGDKTTWNDFVRMAEEITGEQCYSPKTDLQRC